MAASSQTTPFDRTAQRYNALVAFGLGAFCVLSVVPALKVMAAPTIAAGLLSAGVMIAYGAAVTVQTRRGRILPWLRYPGTFLPLFFLSLFKLSMLFGRLGYGGVLKDSMSFDAFFLLVVLSAFYADRRLTLAAGVAAALVNALLLGIGIAFFGVAPTMAVEAAIEVGQVRLLMELLRCSLFVFVALAVNVLLGHMGALLTGLRRSEAQARGVLDSVAEVQPVVQAVLVPIRETAHRLAERANTQATVSRQIGAATAELVESVRETATHAGEARETTARTGEDARSGNEKLASVRAQFQEALERVDAVGARLGLLSDSLDRTEAINRALRDISDRLRYLAINASLEAAKAGDRGSGFAVVAHEVQRLVEETGADLSGSRLVLGDIRDQVAAINSLAERATANLSDSLAELTEASSLNGRIVEAFEQTAVKVEAIATAAADQARAVSEVSAALTDLDHGASEIDAASATLLTGVDRMACAHGELESVLSESGDAAPEARPLVASSA